MREFCVYCKGVLKDEKDILRQSHDYCEEGMKDAEIVFDDDVYVSVWKSLEGFVLKDGNYYFTDPYANKSSLLDSLNIAGRKYLQCGLSRELSELLVLNKWDGPDASRSLYRWGLLNNDNPVISNIFAGISEIHLGNFVRAGFFLEKALENNSYPDSSEFSVHAINLFLSEMQLVNSALNRVY